MMSRSGRRQILDDRRGEGVAAPAAGRQPGSRVGEQIGQPGDEQASDDGRPERGADLPEVVVRSGGRADLATRERVLHDQDEDLHAHAEPDPHHREVAAEDPGLRAGVMVESSTNDTATSRVPTIGSHL